jgi:prevent-host-death family protein
MKHSTIVKTIEALEARVHFGSVLEEVEKSNTRFLVSKRGKPKMIMLSVNDYLQNIVKSDSLLTKIHVKAKEAGLDKITDEEIEAEVKAVRKAKAEKKQKAG